MQFREKSKKRIVINITSLIDVLFLLLIFFMVSSTFLERPGMKLDLPKASQKQAVRMKGYTLFITKEEKLYLNDREIQLDNLKTELSVIQSDLDDEGIILHADESIHYGLVIEIMDVIKETGIKKLTVATEVKEP